MIVTLDMAKELEAQIKLVLMNLYGKMLPSDKVTLLNTTEFIDEEIIKGNSHTVVNNIIRKITGSVIDVTCTKELNIGEDDYKEVLYGGFLNDGLIEFYSEKVAEKLRVNLDEKPEFKENLEAVKALYDKLGDGLDEKAFTEDAIKLLDDAKLEELVTTCDNAAIEEYLKSLEVANNTIENEEVKPLNGNGGKIDEEGRVQIVYLDGKQYIKYVDKNDETHLVESNDSKHVSEIYRKTMLGLKPGEKLDSEKFFQELTSYIPETDLNVKEDIKTSSLNNEEVNMLNYIHGKEEFRLDSQDDVITHSSDQKIHVIENTNDIVVTNDEDGRVESTIISDDEDAKINEEIKPDKPQEEEIDDEKILTPEEYEKLCMKFANNEELTIEELRALRRSTPEEMKKTEEAKKFEEEMQEEESKIIEEQKGPTLKYPGYKSGSAAFTNKYLLIYIVLITICIGFIVGALLFKTFGMK